MHSLHEVICILLYFLNTCLNKWVRQQLQFYAENNTSSGPMEQAKLLSLIDLECKC